MWQFRLPVPLLLLQLYQSFPNFPNQRRHRCSVDFRSKECRIVMFCTARSEQKLGEPCAVSFECHATSSPSSRRVPFLKSFIVPSASSAAILMLSELAEVVGIASRVKTKRKACLNLVRTRFLSVARFEIPLIVVTNPNGVYPCLT